MMETEQQAQRLTAEVSTTRERVEQAADRLQQINTVVSEDAKTVEYLHGQMQNILSQSASLLQQKDELQQQLSRLQLERERIIQELQAAKSASEQDVLALRTENVTLRQQISKINANISQSLQTLTEANERLRVALQQSIPTSNIETLRSDVSSVLSTLQKTITTPVATATQQRTAMLT